MNQMIVLGSYVAFNHYLINEYNMEPYVAYVVKEVSYPHASYL